MIITTESYSIIQNPVLIARLMAVSGNYGTS